MKKENKDLAGAIADSMSPKKDSSSASPAADDKNAADDSGTEGDMSEEEAAASEVMDAMKSDNVADFTDSLKNFIKICSYDSKE